MTSEQKQSEEAMRDLRAACCSLHRSQHKNRIVVQEMIEWALASAKF